MIKTKTIQGRLTTVILVMSLAIWTVSPVQAAVIFQEEDTSDFESEGIVLDALNQADTEIVIQFGESLAETLKWSIVNARFELSNNLDLTNHQLTTARMENVTTLPGGGEGLSSEGIGRFVFLTAIDSIAPGCTAFDCNSGMYVWDGTTWELTTNSSPLRTVSVAPGESIQNAIDSFGSGGGIVKLEIGIHDITDSIIIESDNVEIAGDGPGTIVRAQSGSWVGGVSNNDAVIQVGVSAGTSPKSNINIKNFQLQIGPDIHGIQVNGGYEIKILDMVVESIGAKSNARVGILFTDGSASAGSRFTSARNLIKSNSSVNRWVDGIHMDGNADIAGQMFGYGNGITDSIVYETIVEESKETAFAFIQVSASSVFSNRARNMGFTSGAYGIFLNDVTDVMINNNAIEGANNTADGIFLYDNVDNTTIIGNAIRGGPVNFSTGINVVNSTSSGNVISGNQFANINSRISDNGTNTKLETLHHRSGSNPTVNDDIGDGYEIGTIWINTSSNESWILVDHTGGAAVWNQIDAAGGGGSTAIPTGSVPLLACNAGNAGEQFMDTDTGIVYVCDSSNGRNKWLSQQDIMIPGRKDKCESGDNIGSDPKGCSIGLIGDGNSVYIPYPITITGYGFSMESNECASGSFDLEVWSTGSSTNSTNLSFESNISTGLNGKTYNAAGLNIDINGDQYISWGIDNNCGSNQDIDDYILIIYYRYHNT